MGHPPPTQAKSWLEWATRTERLKSTLSKLSQSRDRGLPFRPTLISMITINLLGGWIGILAGVVSGAVIGLFFWREDWMGGYDSWRRRLTRLGHISFFGLGLLNLLFAATAAQLGLAGRGLQIASASLLTGAIAMPVCCFLSAWRKPLRHLFPIPVLAVTAGVVAILIGGWPR